MSQKKVPTFALSVTLSNLNRFSKFLHCWKAYEICYKPKRHYPRHLRHVSPLPWEIKNSNFLQIFSRYGRKCKQFAFLIACSFASRTDCKLNFSIHCCFIYLFLRSICGSRNSSQQTSLPCLSTMNIWYEMTRRRF